MPRLTTAYRHLTCAALLALSWLGAAPSAWASGFQVEVAGARSVALAAPKPVTPSGDPGGAAEVVWGTMWRDLEMSGYFNLINPDAYLDQSGQVQPGTFRFEDWSLVRTAVLVKTQLLPPGAPGCVADKVCVDLYVYYVVSGDTLVKQRLQAPAKDARAIGHTAADAVLLAVTGQKGLFSSRIVAVNARGGNKEIALLDLDGEGVAPVTRNGSINLSPAFAPDGRRVAWTSYKRGNPDLYVKDLGSGRTRVVSRTRGINASPAFSPDGRTIALARSDDGDSDIFLIDAATGVETKRLTRGGGIDVSPTWSPDGRYLAFASERSGGSQIYLADLQTGEQRRVTFQGDMNSDPEFSPTGDRIAFVSRQAGRFDVFVVGVDGKGLVRITQGMGDNEDPSFSPDGRYLIFSSTRNGRSELWLSTADGRVQTQITKSGSWSQPSFRPGAQ